MANSNDNSQMEVLLKYGVLGGFVYGAYKVGQKVFGGRGNPGAHHPWTKKRIRDETTVRHISRNNYAYSYETADNRRFHKDGLDHDIILTEQTKLGPEEYIIGSAKNKKEFVDEVYDHLNTGRHRINSDNPDTIKVVLEKHHDEEGPWWTVIAVNPSDLKSNSDYYSDGNYKRKKVTEKNEDHIDFILEQEGVNPIYARKRGRGWQYSTL